MEKSLDVSTRLRLRRRGLVLAGRHDWASVALRHLAVYEALAEVCHA
jgi:hypothetical protein